MGLTATSGSWEVSFQHILSIPAGGFFFPLCPDALLLLIPSGYLNLVLGQQHVGDAVADGVDVLAVGADHLSRLDVGLLDQIKNSVPVRVRR